MLTVMSQCLILNKMQGDALGPVSTWRVVQAEKLRMKLLCTERKKRCMQLPFYYRLRPLCGLLSVCFLRSSEEGGCGCWNDPQETKIQWIFSPRPGERKTTFSVKLRERKATLRGHGPLRKSDYTLSQTKFRGKQEVEGKAVNWNAQHSSSTVQSLSTRGQHCWLLCLWKTAK